MAHPRRFQANDPLLSRVRLVALALPGAQEKISHGRPAFFTDKVFAYYGGSTRESDGPRNHDAAVMIRPDPDDAPALRQDARFWTPMYLGPRGWLGIDLTSETEWDEIAELLDASFRVTAPRRLVHELGDLS